MEEVQPGDEDRVFYQLSVPKKVIVMLGGPTMNLLIAVVLLTGVATLYGMRTAAPRRSAPSRSASPCRPSARPRRSRARPATPSPRRKAGSGPATASCPSAAPRSARGTRSARSIRPNGDRTLPLVVDGAAQRLALQRHADLHRRADRRRPGQARAGRCRQGAHRAGRLPGLLPDPGAGRASRSPPCPGSSAPRSARPPG